MTGLRPMISSPRGSTSLRTSLWRLPVLGAVLTGILLLGGCGTGANVASHIDAQQIQPLDEVAVVSIRTKKLYQNEIGEPSVGGTKNVRKAVSTIKDVTERQGRRADPDYQAASKQVRSYLFGSFRSAAPFSLADEGSILQSSAYQTFEVSQGDSWRSSLFATPDSYRSLDPTRLKAKAFLQKLTEGLSSNPDGVLFAETKYTLVRDDVRHAKGEMWTSNIRDGTNARTTLSDGDTVHVDVKATVRIHVLDRSGSTAMKVVQTARSDEGFSFVYGKGWNATQIDGPARRATQAAVENVTHQLRNKLSDNVLARASSALPTF